MNFGTSKKIVLDLYQNRYVSTNVAQYDIDSRELIVQITDDGQPYYLDPTTVKVRIKYMKTDGNPVFNDCEILENGTVKVTYTDQMTAVAGRCDSELMLMDAKSQAVLHTMHFISNVIASSVGDDVIESTPEFTSLERALIKVEGLEETIKNADKLVEQLDETLSDAEASETIRKQNEILRTSAEILRDENEQKRIDAEEDRETNETERLKNENARTDAENIRIENEEARQVGYAEMQNKVAKTYSQEEIDNKFSALETNIDWKEAVETYDDIATTYPSPIDGWTVNVKDKDYTYRYNGTAWIAISANAIPKATNELDGLLSKEDHTNYEDANNKKHTHSNKTVLDGISSTSVNTWNTVSDKVDKVEGKGLSTNDYTDEEKSQVATNKSGIAELQKDLSDLEDAKMDKKTFVAGSNVTITENGDEITISSTGGGTGTVGSLEDLGITATATELNYMDGVKSNVQTQIDNLGKSVAEGKSTLATTLSNNGVTTASDASFATINTNIGTVATNKYNAGVSATKKGTATAAQVLTGYTFTNASSIGASGTMPSNSLGTAVAAVGCDSKAPYAHIPYGYYPNNTTNQGYSYVYLTKDQAKLMANAAGVGYDAGMNDAQVGTATSDKVLEGYTFTNANGVGLEGTMTDRTKDGTPVATDISYNGVNSLIKVPAGYYGSNGGGEQSLIAVTNEQAKSLANNVGVGYNAGVIATKVGTSTPDQVLSGYTFTCAIASGMEGTMPNNGAVSQSLNCGGSYTIPAGYHNGSGKVTANSLASQTSATATADKILSGQTAWVNGSKITGSLSDSSGSTATTSAYLGGGMNRLFFPMGYYDHTPSLNAGNGYVSVPSNIVNTMATALGIPAANYNQGYHEGRQCVIDGASDCLYDYGYDGSGDEFCNVNDYDSSYEAMYTAIHEISDTGYYNGKYDYGLTTYTATLVSVDIGSWKAFLLPYYYAFNGAYDVIVIISCRSHVHTGQFLTFTFGWSDVESDYVYRQCFDVDGKELLELYGYTDTFVVLNHDAAVKDLSMKVFFFGCNNSVPYQEATYTNYNDFDDAGSIASFDYL